MDFILVSAFLCPGKKCGQKFTVYMAETLRTPNPQRPPLPRLRPYILKTQKIWTSETKDHYFDLLGLNTEKKDDREPAPDQKPKINSGKTVAYFRVEWPGYMVSWLDSSGQGLGIRGQGKTLNQKLKTKNQKPKMVVGHSVLPPKPKNEPGKKVKVNGG